MHIVLFPRSLIQCRYRWVILLLDLVQGSKVTVRFCIPCVVPHPSGLAVVK